MVCSFQPGDPLRCPDPEQCSSGPSAAGSAAAAAGDGQLECSGEPGSSMPSPEESLEEKNNDIQLNISECVNLALVNGWISVLLYIEHFT